MGGILRCLQTGGLRLNDTVAANGAESLPVRQQLQDARYLTASRLFDAAIREHVHALIMVGPTLGNPVVGSRAPWFLIREFQRLEQYGIAVIIRSDDLPPPPPGMTWPANVHLVSPQVATGVRVRDGQFVRCCDARGDLHFRDSDSHRIVISKAAPSPSLLAQSPQIYWACESGAGESLRYLVTGDPQPDGFDAQTHSQPVGFALQADQVTQSRRIGCEAVNWHTETIETASISSGDELKSTLSFRLRKIDAESVVPTLVRFTLTGDLESLLAVTDQQLAQVLRQLQQHEWGMAWPAAIESGIAAGDHAETHGWRIARHSLSDLITAAPIDLSVQCQIPVEQVKPDLRIVPRNDALALEARVLKRLPCELVTAVRSA